MGSNIWHVKNLSRGATAFSVTYPRTHAESLLRGWKGQEAQQAFHSHVPHSQELGSYNVNIHLPRRRDQHLPSPSIATSAPILDSDHASSDHHHRYGIDTADSHDWRVVQPHHICHTVSLVPGSHHHLHPGHDSKHRLDPTTRTFLLCRPFQ